MVFVDTNYFLRFLLHDINDQFEVAKNLFLEASRGEKAVFTSLLVFFEISWVLESFYGSKKIQIIQALAKILEMSFVGLSEREVLKLALDVYENSSVSLEDSYSLVYSKTEGAAEFATFDQKLAKKFADFNKPT